MPTEAQGTITAGIGASPTSNHATYTITFEETPFGQIPSSRVLTGTISTSQDIEGNWQTTIQIVVARDRAQVYGWPQPYPYGYGWGPWGPWPGAGELVSGTPPG